MTQIDDEAGEPAGAPRMEDLEVRIVHVDPKRERQIAEAIARSPDASLVLNTILDAAFPEETGTTAPAGGG